MSKVRQLIHQDEMGLLRNAEELVEHVVNHKIKSLLIGYTLNGEGKTHVYIFGNKADAAHLNALLDIMKGDILKYTFGIDDLVFQSSEDDEED